MSKDNKAGNDPGDKELFILVLFAVAFIALTYLVHHPQYFVGAWRIFLKPQVSMLYFLSQKAPYFFKWYSILVHNDPSDIVVIHQYVQADNIFVLSNYVPSITRYIAKFYLPIYIIIFLPIVVRATTVMSKVEGKRGIKSGPFLTFKSYLEYIKYLSTRLSNINFIGHHLKTLSKGSIYEGELRTADSPIQWCERLGVISRNANDEIETKLSLAQIEKIRNELVKNLGELFVSLDVLEKKYAEILKHIYALFPSKSVLEEAKKQAIKGHIYEYTVILSLLLYARRFGVLASLSFLGMKAKNRVLWYVIVSAGMNVAYMEAGAVLSQYRYELAIKKINQKRLFERRVVKKQFDLGVINAEEANTRQRYLKELTPKTNQVKQAIKGIVEALAIDPDELPWKEHSLWDNFDPLA